MDCQLVWHIEEAEFEFPSSKEFRLWKSAGKKIYFEFDPPNSDDGGSTVFEDPTSESKYFELDTSNAKVVLDENNKKIKVTAWVIFQAKIKKGLKQEVFKKWAYEKAGWYCGTISLAESDSYISSDKGGELRLQQSIQRQRKI